MNKPLTYDRQGFADKKLKSILPQTPYLNQIFLSIRQNQLTEVIEALESVGIKGDIAIFILANLQAWEGKTDV